MLTPDAPVFDQSGAPSPAARHTLAEATHRPDRQPAKQVPCGSRTAGYNAKGVANPGSRADGDRKKRGSAAHCHSRYAAWHRE